MFWFIPKHSIDNSINSQLYQIQQDVSYIREYLEKRELKLSFYLIFVHVSSGITGSFLNALILYQLDKSFLSILTFHEVQNWI